MHGHDIGVRQLLRFHRFLLQGDEGLGMVLEILPQHLDRDVGVAVLRLDLAQVTGLVHKPHAALAQHVLQHKALFQQAPTLGPRSLRQLPGAVKAG